MPKLRRRQRLRRKEAIALVDQIRDILGVEIAGADEPLELAEADSWQVILVKGRSIGLILDNQPFLTVRGLLALQPNRRYVTVDMGAVKFVYNGADVMAPGIVDADSSIKPGDIVWIRDEKNKRPLAIGAALLAGNDMVSSRSGKAVKSIHHVGDDLWRLDEE